MLMLLCGACGSEGGGGEDPTPTPTPDKPDVKSPSTLEIHVYTPEHPVVTRAETDEVEPEEDEMAVNTLDIWVYVAEAKGSLQVGDLVGHLSPSISASSSSSASSFVGSYQMTVSEEFAEQKPKVDVYVAVNKASTGIASLIPTATATQLKEAVISGSNFGLTSPITTPPTAGLPMSGVLKSQTIDDTSVPLLKVNTPVKVVRAVSKVRFVFTRTDTGAADELRITGININSGIIPKKECLFLDAEYTAGSYKIDKTDESPYESAGALSPLTARAGNVPVSTYPAQYAYTDQDGQTYETLINGGITSGDLAQVGRFYLRESDQQVTGTIQYTIGNSETKTAVFSMTGEKDFTRNHTWIVYGYFAGKENLKVYSIDVTDWRESTADYPVYNW